MCGTDAYQARDRSEALPVAKGRISFRPHSDFLDTAPRFLKIPGVNSPGKGKPLIAGASPVSAAWYALK